MAAGWTSVGVGVGVLCSGNVSTEGLRSPNMCVFLPELGVVTRVTTGMGVVRDVGTERSRGASLRSSFFGTSSKIRFGFDWWWRLVKLHGSSSVSETSGSEQLDMSSERSP